MTLPEPRTAAEMVLMGQHVRWLAARARLWDSPPPPPRPSLTRRIWLLPPAPPPKTTPIDMPYRALGATVRRYAREVAKRHKIAVADLMSDGRKRPIIDARTELCGLLHFEARLSLSEIGRRIGRDHTSVLHLVDKWRGFAKTAGSSVAPSGVPARSVRSFPQHG